MSVRQDRITVVSRQRCPRRDEGYGYQEQSPEADAWERGRWAATPEEAKAEVDEFMARNPTGMMGNPQWRWSSEQPRTCSFCGGVHPDDAVALIRAGWGVGGTDKWYKRYLNPPTGTGSPLPPVKVYTQHFTAEQIEAFNAALGLPPRPVTPET